jgi:hypothetical protein
VSLILDALNRSRGETGEVPNLDAVHAAANEREAPGRAWLPWLALVIAVLVIAWLLLDRDAASPGQVTAPPEISAPPTPSVPAPPAEAEPRVVSPEPARSVAVVTPREASPPAASEASTPSTVDPDVAALYARQADAAPAISPDIADAGQPVAAANPAASEPAETAVAAPAPPVTQEQAVDIEQMIRQAENELENARLAEHPAPFISALSQQVKDGIPTLLYERHDYSGNPGQSRVVINGQSLARGGTTKGVRVEEILPDSVVLSFRDTQFRLRALNSWVNL